MDENPYRAPQSDVEVLEAAVELRLGGRGERLGAVIIDGFIGFAAMLVVAVPIIFATGVWRTFIEMAMRGEQMPYWVQIAMSAAGFAMFVLVQGRPLKATGQTWGKRVLKLRIVDLQGNKPEFGRLIAMRYGIGQVAMLIPVLGVLYALADMLLIFRADKRCLHDHIAGTRVVVAD